MKIPEPDRIEDADLLGSGDLESLGGRGVGDDAAGPYGEVRCGRPLFYPVPDADLPPPLRRRAEATGHRYAGGLFALDLVTARRCTAARFEVSLDHGVIAVRVDEDGDGLGLGLDGGAATTTAAVAAAVTRQRTSWWERLAGRRHVTRPQVVGQQSDSFGWLYDGDDGELPRRYGMHALLEIPADVAEIGGRIDVQVTLDRRTLSLRRTVSFTEKLAAAQPCDGATVRLCMAADIASYSSRTYAEAERVQIELLEILASARRAAGIDESAVSPQAQGDGQFTVLPAGIDESAVVPRLLAELGDRLRSQKGDRMRLRVALHRGLVKEGPNGWIGAAAIAVHRILDCDPLREALAGNGDAAYVLGLPDVLYRDVIVPADRPPRADEFTTMLVDLPKKGFVEHCWLLVGPGARR